MNKVASIHRWQTEKNKVKIQNVNCMVKRGVNEFQDKINANSEGWKFQKYCSLWSSINFSPVFIFLIFKATLKGKYYSIRNSVSNKGVNTSCCFQNIPSRDGLQASFKYIVCLKYCCLLFTVFLT